MTSCLDVSECRLSLSATVVGGVDLDDAVLDKTSNGGAEKLLSGDSDIEAGWSS